MLSPEDIEKLSVRVREVCGGWSIADITYDGEVIKSVEV
jgi:hypothetical protein